MGTILTFPASRTAAAARRHRIEEHLRFARSYLAQLEEKLAAAYREADPHDPDHDRWHALLALPQLVEELKNHIWDVQRHIAGGEELLATLCDGYLLSEEILERYFMTSREWKKSDELVGLLDRGVRA